MPGSTSREPDEGLKLIKTCFLSEASLHVVLVVWPVLQAEVEKVKTLSGKLHFRSTTFCQIAHGQPSPDPPNNDILLNIFKQQFLQNNTQNIFYKTL